MMRPLVMRELPPARRKSWTKSAGIEDHVGPMGCVEVTFTVGEYADGRPCEIFIDVSKEGTFLRGVMDTLARMASISLQCGGTIEMICKALRGVDYPPAGAVRRINQDGPEPCVATCDSVTDWIASELWAAYGATEEEQVFLKSPAGEGDPAPAPILEKAAGHISQEGWSYRGSA